MRKTMTALVLASAAAAFSLTGCSIQEASCSDGEYPAMAVGDTGDDCFPNGEEPPKGYTRYPEGKVPKYVGDKWDTYWQSHTVDGNGKIIKTPAP